MASQIWVIICFPSAAHPYSHLIEGLKDGKIKFFNPEKLNDPRYGELEFTPSKWLILLRQNCKSQFVYFLIIKKLQLCIRSCRWLLNGLFALIFCADKLPLSIRVLLEAAIRNCDGFYTKEEDVENILDWQQQQNKATVAFTPARVLLQDFTWVPERSTLVPVIRREWYSIWHFPFWFVFPVEFLPWWT